LTAAETSTPKAGLVARLQPWAEVVPVALLVLVAVWEIWAASAVGSDVPSDADWRSASDHVRASHGEGDLIVFAPSWLDPVGRLYLGDLIPVDMAARMDAARYEVIWELSARGQRAAEVDGLSADNEQRFGGVTVRRFQRAPAVVLTDFVSELSRTRIVGKASRRPTASLQEVGFEPHRCVLTVPHAGEEVKILYPKVVLGTKLVGYVGLADIFERRDIRQSAGLEIIVGDQSVAFVQPGVDDGWVRFEADTTPGRADVTFVASATSGRRLICFAAEARQ